MNIAHLKKRIPQVIVSTLLIGSFVQTAHAQNSTAEVEAHNSFGSGFGNNGGTGGGGGGGGGGADPGSGTQPQPSPTPETFQASFEVGASGKQVRQDCAACHWLEVHVDGRKLEYGETVTLSKSKTHEITVKDNPQTRGNPPEGAKPPHDDNQTFTVYPVAVGNQTITEVPGSAGDPPKAFIVNKDAVIDYMINNSEKLLAQNKEWPKNAADEPMNKKAQLIPLEIVDKDKKPLKQLKVGKMADTGVLSGSGSSATLDIDKDADRFYIRIPKAAGLGGSSIKLSTVENSDSNYNDGETEIDLEIEGEDLISKSLLLVSDDVDDSHQVDGISDNAKNDRTHKIQLGGKLKLNKLKIANTEYSTEYKLTVPVVKTVKVNIVILTDLPYGSGDPVVSQASVTAFWNIVKECYAQVGVKIVVESIRVENPPSGVNLNNGLSVMTTAGDVTIADEAKALISAYGSPSDVSDIHVFYVNEVRAPNSIAGIALADFVFGTIPSNRPYLDNVFLSDLQTLPNAGLMAAHELGHVLTNAGHNDSSTTNLMRSTIIVDEIMTSRRLTNDSEISIHKSPHAN